ncbi:MAG: SxtJ family membrane protein [Bdellovibrionales bacterium]
MHENFFDRHEKTERSSERSFGLVMACFFLIVGGSQLYHDRAGGWIWLGAAVMAGVLALFAAWALRIPNRLWGRLGLLLAHITQPLILGAFFYLVVAPIGLLLRLAGKDTLGHAPDPLTVSYWRPYSSSSQGDMRKQY